MNNGFSYGSASTSKGKLAKVGPLMEALVLNALAWVQLVK